MVFVLGAHDSPVIPSPDWDEWRKVLSSIDAINGGDPTGSVTSTSHFLCSPMMAERENIQPSVIVMQCNSALSETCSSIEYDSCGKRRKLSPISDLVDSLLIEILCRIHCGKLLIRCKCVSKRWFNLVSSPFFVRHRFLNHHGSGHPTKPSPSPIQHNLSLLEMDPKESRFWFQESDLPLSKALMDKGLCLLASHNDLLLCSPKLETCMDANNFCICNPFTMDLIVLPPAPDPVLKAQHDYSGAGLLVKYNCSEEVEDKCDATSNQLQFWVVRLRRQRGGIVADIYSSESRMWKESVLPGSSNWLLRFSVVHNDKLHWVVDSELFISQDTKLIAYDPSTMECQYIPVPKMDDKLRNYIVGTCCGFLRLVAVHYRDSKQYDGLAYLVIWELKNHEVGEWSLIHKIYFNEMVCKKFQVSRSALHPLAIEEKDRNTVYMKIKGYTFSFDLQTKELEVVLKNQKLARNRMLSLVLQQQPTPLRDNFHFKPSSQSTSLEHTFTHLQITKLCSE